MRPALSLILFTTLAGAAQGLVVVLALATLGGVAPAGSMAPMLWLATAMLLAALLASFFHLGHPLRAWRAALMWRTSWMSREVIVLPAFIALVAAWALHSGGAQPASRAAHWLATLAIPFAFALWYCTAMIYACVRFVQEWAHPLTVINYTLLGLASGAVTAGAVFAVAGETAFAGGLAGWALTATTLAWFTRALALRRNARLRLKSTIQSATGVDATRLVQVSMGMTGGSFNTREFFHGVSARAVRMCRVGFQVLAFALPIALLTTIVVSGSVSTGVWLVALLLQAAGLLAERWFFFAQARHPQNIYYQAVS